MTIESSTASDTDLKMVEQVRLAQTRLRSELAKIVIGQGEVIDQLLIAILSQGHCLLEGVPGLAKTLMISTLSRALQLQFSRIQFTPDLMPADITGTEVLQEDKATGHREFRFLPGPIFSNMVLADEINRTPPKTQAALLEAMQERQVTVGGQRRPLPAPFFVLATQNPIEQEGTYTLPEAQQDRFMFKVLVKYPSYDDEYQIAEATTSGVRHEVSQVLSAEEIIRLQELVRKVPVPPYVIHYALRLVRATRVHEPEGVPDFIREHVSWGAGPRALQYLLLGGKARAVLDARFCVTTEDVRSVALPVLRHRVMTSFAAESAGLNSDTIVKRLLDEIPQRQPQDELPPEAARAFVTK